MIGSSAKRRRLQRKLPGFLWKFHILTSTDIWHRRFGNFFNHIDHFQNNFFLYCTSGGIAAAKLVSAPTEKGTSKETNDKAAKDQSAALAQVESSTEDEGDLPDGGEEGN
jgi:hypothetical protein